jgi:hypothetical protein
MHEADTTPTAAKTNTANPIPIRPDLFTSLAYHGKTKSYGSAFDAQNPGKIRVFVTCLSSWLRGGSESGAVKDGVASILRAPSSVFFLRSLSSTA